MSEGLWMIIIFGGIAAAFAGFYFLRKRGSIDRGIWKALDSEVGHPKHLAQFKYSYTTPEGARVRSTVPVPDVALNAVDNGIRNQIVRHNRKFPHWNNYRSISDYDVLFVEPTAHNVETEPGSPAILVRGTQSAGSAIGLEPRSAADRPYMVIPHQEAEGWRFINYLMRTAWNESEHVREAVNDYGVFLHYAHTGDIHPHVDFEDMPSLKALMDDVAPLVHCAMAVQLGFVRGEER